MDEFQKLKESRLSGVDLSRKGSVDEKLTDLISWINSCPSYFTTSSCSGRIVVFSEHKENGMHKKGCRWHLTSHEKVNDEQLMSSLEPTEGQMVLKFEPFILHVQCKSLQAAKLMHTLALEAGFRNSGITLGKKEKVILAVRSTHCLEVPLSQDDELLVTQKFLKLLAQTANEKLEETWRRTEIFYQLLKSSLEMNSTERQPS